MEIQNYYCSQKFDWVEVRLYDGLVASCCQSTTHRLTLPELESHPVGFFNYPVIQKERQLMLDNVRTPSCESCWKVEENNIDSRRTLSNSDIRRYHQLEQLPKTVNFDKVAKSGHTNCEVKFSMQLGSKRMTIDSL